MSISQSRPVSQTICITKVSVCLYTSWDMFHSQYVFLHLLYVYIPVEICIIDNMFSYSYCLYTSWDLYHRQYEMLQLKIGTNKLKARRQLCTLNLIGKSRQSNSPRCWILDYVHMTQEISISLHQGVPTKVCHTAKVDRGKTRNLYLYK